MVFFSFHLVPRRENMAHVIRGKFACIFCVREKREENPDGKEISDIVKKTVVLSNDELKQN